MRPATSRNILIGTAGHIDHGKTSLVRRLTGIDTDRLPEEKARGISIDLGFAHWDAGRFRFGVVDVPGHERFVRNMVAGATGIHLALLVVAADDGVMPQTREHLDVMRLLGVSAGLVALTKTDLVSPEHVELARAEIAELTAGTFLAGRPVVAVSSRTGDGLDELRRALVAVAEALERPAPLPLFRMPIDRVFSLPGKGTIVTGSVPSGAVRAGDALELLPAQRPVRIRGVQSHGEVGDAGPGQRAGLNLAGLRVDEIERGMELAAPGYLVPTQRLVVELTRLAFPTAAVRHRQKLVLHVGTCETECRLILKANAPPNEPTPAELRTARPVVAAWGERFILRRVSPPLTIAGGAVRDPSPGKRRIRDLDVYARALGSPDEAIRLDALLARGGAIDIADSSLALEAARRAGIAPDRLAQVVTRLEGVGKLVAVGPRALRLHCDTLARWSAAAMRSIRAELDRHQPRRTLPRNSLLQACRSIAEPNVLDGLFAHLIATDHLVERENQLGPADMQPKLTNRQQAARRRSLERIEAAGLTPPTARELAADVELPVAELTQLLDLCVEEGLLTVVEEGMYFPPAALGEARQVAERLLAGGATATMSQLREAWGTTRKYSLPLCTWLDRQGVTRREGDLRRLSQAVAARSPAPVMPESPIR